MSTTEYIIESFLSLVGRLPPDEQRKVFVAILQKSESMRKDVRIPVSIFSRELGSLESTVKYLKENLSLSTKEIAEILDRSHSAIITTYNKAYSKSKAKIKAKESIYSIPARVLAKRHSGVLETIVAFLKDEYGLHFNDIAGQLKRNYQTIRTAYIKHKAKQ